MITVILCDLYTFEEPGGVRHWYHILMKLFCAIALFAASLLAVINPDLRHVSSVYILPMGSGMDQFLANRLTTLGVFQVVTDPQKADALITDRIGESFQDKLEELYPPPKPVVKDEKKDDKKDKKDDMSAAPIPHISSFNTGKGNFFIVDRRSRNVLWSIYERPKNSTPSELTKTAEKVVKHLKDDLIEK
jgi:hypothetical protein